MAPRKPTGKQAKQSRKLKKPLAWFFLNKNIAFGKKSLKVFLPQPERIILLTVFSLTTAFFMQAESLAAKEGFVPPKTEVKNQLLRPVNAAEDSPLATSSAQAEKPTLVSQGKVVVPTLMYHYIQNPPSADELTISLSVTPQNFEEQMNYLVTHGYTSISPRDLQEALLNNIPLPPKPILLTFDDGYRDFYHTAYPILKKLNLRATAFIATGLVNKDPYLKDSDIKEMSQDPNITFAGHTVNHLNLTKIPSNQVIEELSSGKKQLEEWSAQEVNYFAYPGGSFNDQVINLVKEAGYKLAFSTRYGSTHMVTSLMEEPRVRISGSDSLAVFIDKITDELKSPQKQD